MKKNLALIIALVLPILMLIFVIGLIYLPRTILHPHYNFLYATGVDYYWPSQYIVKNNQLIKQSPPQPNQVHSNEELYLYDVRTDEITQINYATAEQFRLDPNPVAPDGFRIAHGAGDSSFFSLFFFSSPSYNTRFLQNGDYSKRLKLKLVGQFYNNFHFIGWVLNGKTSTARWNRTARGM